MPTAVVTGAASGIGRALAVQLAREGHRVTLTDLAPTDQLAAELGGVAATVDVASRTAMLRLAEAGEAPAFVCLNAGIVGTTTGSPWEASADEWCHVLRVNLGGVVNGLAAFLPRLITRGEPANILITASLAGLLTFPGGGAYAASKHAVVAVAEQAALAAQGTPVTITVLCPALVRTGMSAEGADPAEVASEGLAAARAGRFLVMPEEWVGAAQQRASALLAGEQPSPPSPDGAPTD